MINSNTTIEEQEQAAYMAGDTRTAELLARIDDLQKALGDTLAENLTLRQENDILRTELRVAQIDRAYGGSMH